MEIVFLGTSSAIPTNNRNHSALALKAFGEIILFDCGEGTQRQMTRARLSPMKIDRIFVTHFHGDHILGIPGLIQSMAFRGRRDTLEIYGPPGIQELLNSMKKLGYFALSFNIAVHEIKDGTVLEEDDFKISAQLMKHSVENYAYCIEEKRDPKFIKEKALKLGIKPGPAYGKLQSGLPVKIGNKIIKPEEVLGEKRRGRKLVYSGDTLACEEMVGFSKDADVLIHESTFNNSHKEKAFETGHSTAEMAADIAKKAGVKSLVLTHISTRYKDVKTLEMEALNVFEDSVVAEDLMRLEVEQHDD
ncbi:Ribonuclease Z [Methanobacterium lacus]|uniref:Ribonuclease Z n=1 Tax=Methanobacterium lacus (strain AL-21) TaxID=877455 RepID=F0TAE4_METLA|nr:ribonuclease Z [Methanobacterium lacus]ADZ08896.1 Ribonuclease Z [Methanobacterium lacus]